MGLKQELLLLHSHKLTPRVSSIIPGFLSNFINTFNFSICIMHPYSLAVKDDSAKRHFMLTLVQLHAHAFQHIPLLSTEQAKACPSFDLQT